MQAIEIENGSSPKVWRNQDHGLEKCDELSISENRTHDVWVDRVVRGPSFSWVKVLSVSTLPPLESLG